MNNQSKIVGYTALIAGVLAVLLAGLPLYNVWQQSLSGKAELQKAEYTRQVAVLEAQAELDSASRKGEAEVVRARGVAEANKIIGDSLKNNPEYLQYLWITQGEKGTNRTVYMVPSGGGGAPVPTFDVTKELPPTK